MGTHVKTIQLRSPIAVGNCRWLQSCLNKLDGVLIEHGRVTMLSQEINQYGAFEMMRHIGEALKSPAHMVPGYDNADMQRASEAQNAKSFLCHGNDSER